MVVFVFYFAGKVTLPHTLCPPHQLHFATVLTLAFFGASASNCGLIHLYIPKVLWPSRKVANDMEPIFYRPIILENLKRPIPYITLLFHVENCGGRKIKTIFFGIFNGAGQLFKKRKSISSFLSILGHNKIGSKKRSTCKKEKKKHPHVLTPKEIADLIIYSSSFNKAMRTKDV